MIAQLKGKISTKAPDLVTIEVGGIGFEVFIPLSTYYDLPDRGQEVILLTRIIMREEGLFIYGFLTAQERSLFDLLCGVSGIGPRLATNILSGISPQELIGALSTGDSDRLQAIPGVGKKLAARMALELQEKVKGMATELSPQPEPAFAEREVWEDLISALVNLGYQRQKAVRAVRSAMAAGGDNSNFESLIKEALRLLTT